MDRRFALVAFTAGVLWLGAAHARYVSPTPPSGFAPGSGGGFVYTPPTPLEQLDSIRKESAGKPTGWYRTPGPTLPGGAGKPPAAMRFGGGAARALAGAAARGLIPGVGLALGLAWLASNCFEKRGNQWVRTCGGGGPQPEQSTGQQYRVTPQFAAVTCSGWHTSQNAAMFAAYQCDMESKPSTISLHWPQPTPPVVQGWKFTNPYGTYDYNPPVEVRPDGRCPVGYFVGSDGTCYEEQPAQHVTIPEIEDEMELKPLPNVLPAFVPYPLWSPADGSLTPSVFGHPTVVNPNRTYEDSTTPSPQKWRQPQGSPKLNPETGKVEQPVTDWKHKPTDSDPFQMETEPGKVETTDPEGQTEPGTAEEGEPSTPKPESDTQDLCEKNPGILACAHLNPGSLDPVPVHNRDQPLTIDPAGGFGPSSSACPADRTSQVSFGVVAFPYTPLCQFAEGVRPIVLGLAWLLAGFSFFGLSRKT